MKKFLLGLTIFIGCLCLSVAQSHAWTIVDNNNQCWLCHKTTSTPKPPSNSDFENGTAWHTAHMGFDSTCLKCHTSGAGSTPVQTSSCALCHNSTTPTPPLFGPFPCYWPEEHMAAQRYDCINDVCHGNCTAPQTYTISGTVTSSGSGLSGVNMALTGDSTANTTTDASGNYSFSGLSNGSYTVTPSKSGYTFNPTSIPVIISGADQTGKDFTATPTSTGCSAWTDVIVKYNAYVSNSATWNEVITCYNQYVEAHP